MTTTSRTSQDLGKHRGEGRVTASKARRRCVRTGVGCEAARAQALNWRRRRKHSIWWLPMLAGAARARRRAGHRCERTAAPTTRATRVPLWPVAAVVGSVLRGIRIANATASACKRLGNCDSGEWWQSCQRGHLRAAGVGHAAAEVSNWASDHAPAVFQVSTREVWRWSASPGAGERSALAQIICYPRTTPV